jgi:hypothetical protein
MAAPAPNGPRYTVVYSELVQNALKDLADRARRQGVGVEFLAALRMMDARLRRDPEAFGEPNHNLPAARLRVFTRIVRPLVVTYSVHRRKPVVFVRSFKPFPVDAF